MLESLHGSDPKKGDKINLYVGGYVRHSGKTPRVRAQPQIYFIYGSQTDRKTKKKVYGLNCRIDASRKGNIQEALKRRSTYPVVEQISPEGTNTCIEVMFPGDVANAIVLMGSESAAAVTLGARKLLYVKDKAKPEVVAAIREDLFRQAEEGQPDFLKLHNLIQFLGTMGEGTPDGVAGDLIREYIDHIGKSTVQPPKPKRHAHSGYHRKEEDRVDANHALTWLLRTMEQPAALKHFGKPLVELRNRVEVSGRAKFNWHWMSPRSRTVSI